MHFIVPTKRRLANAIRTAYEDRKIDSRLTQDKAQTVSFFGRPALFWPAGACGNNVAHLAYINTRNDMSVYVSYAEPVANDCQLTYWQAA